MLPVSSVPCTEKASKTPAEGRSQRVCPQQQVGLGCIVWSSNHSGIWGTVGPLIWQMGTLRPGQLWELFEHLGSRNNSFRLASSLLPGRSRRRSQACWLLPVRSEWSMSWLLGLAADGSRATPSSSSEAIGPQGSREQPVCRDEQDCVRGGEAEEREPSRLL